MKKLIFGGLAAGTVAVGLAAAVAAQAHADSNDDLFLSTIKHHIFGITNSEGDAGLIKLGKAFCYEILTSRSRASMHAYLTAKDWSDSDASWLITASVASYCPEAG
jgi:Protein of unknown function (DUF732)